MAMMIQRRSVANRSSPLYLDLLTFMFVYHYVIRTQFVLYCSCVASCQKRWRWLEEGKTVAKLTLLKSKLKRLSFVLQDLFAIDQKHSNKDCGCVCHIILDHEPVSNVIMCVTIPGGLCPLVLLSCRWRDMKSVIKKWEDHSLPV